MPGKFIAIEGIDGAGTSSQTAHLKQRLEDRGHRVHVTAEPSSGPIGRLIRELLGRIDDPPDPATMALLFAADRIEHLRTEIVPTLQRGHHVLSDRYLLSSLAYQSLDNPLPWVSTLNQHARPPDLTVLFEVRPDVAAARREGRGGAEELYDARRTQERLAKTYDRLAQELPEQRVVRLDANPDFDTVAADFELLVRGCLEGDG